jgi:hypothetical protein
MPPFFYSFFQLAYSHVLAFNACMFHPQEQKLIDAADILRQSVDSFQCSHFESLLGINNLYFLHLVEYIQYASFTQLEQNQEQRPITPRDLKIALIETCHDFCRSERRSVPFGYETKQSAFLNNLAQILNTPFLEEMHHDADANVEATPSPDPAINFTRVLWTHYTHNWVQRHNQSVLQ